MLHVLVVEDDIEHAVHACNALDGMAHVTVARTHEAALTYLAVMEYDAVMADLSGTDPSLGWEECAESIVRALNRSLAALRRRKPVPLILVSARDPADLRALAARLTHCHALPKPYLVRDLRAMIRALTASP